MFAIFSRLYSPIQARKVEAMPLTIQYKACYLATLWPAASMAQTLSYDANESLFYTQLVIVLLFLACAFLSLLVFTLYKKRKQLLQNEQLLGRKYQELESRLLERSEKLHSLNNQLYDEIAKHEITEELLRKTQGYIQNIINSMPSILIGVTSDHKITHWNTAAGRATSINYDKALGHSINDIAPDLNIDVGMIDKAIQLQKTQKSENIRSGIGSQATFSDQTIYPLLSSDIDGAVILIDDVTLRVRLETMMIQNEKLNSLGEMAAGVAHEINNPLGIILQSIQNIKRRLSPDLKANQDLAKELQLNIEDLNEYLSHRQILEFLEAIKDAGERTSVIVKNMLEFSRAQDADYESVNLVELLDRSIELALQSMNANKSGRKISTNLSKRYQDKIPKVTCSPVEIQQVILNLLSNAHQAFVGSKKRGDLNIEIALESMDKDAVITISDNGPGMDEWTRRHIFDPFFTTKEVGKGTGLGLSVSYFIINEHHHGSIAVDSRKGKGTTFIIHLPINYS
jgi:signal transduction histidine kinase